VHWHNTQRLHGYLGDVSPVEFENAFSAVQADRELLVGIKLRELPSNPGRFTHRGDDGRDRDPPFEVGSAHRCP